MWAYIIWLVGIAFAIVAAVLVWAKSEEVKIGPELSRLAVCLLVAAVIYEVWTKSPAAFWVPTLESKFAIWATYVVVIGSVIAGFGTVVFRAVAGLPDIAGKTKSTLGWGAAVLISTAVATYLLLGVTGSR